MSSVKRFLWSLWCKAFGCRIKAFDGENWLTGAGQCVRCKTRYTAIKWPVILTMVDESPTEESHKNE